MDLNKYFEMNEKEFFKLSESEIKEVLNTLFESLVNTLQEQTTYTKKENQYLEIIENMKLFLLSPNLFSSEKMKIKKETYIKQLFKISRNILNITYDKQVKIYMEYINNHDIPSKNQDILFTNIKNRIYEINSMYKWFINQLVYNLEEFEITCRQFGKEYPIAYKKIKKEIGSFKKLIIPLKPMIDSFIKYIDKNSIPTVNNKEITFGSIGCNVRKNAYVGPWFRYHISANQDIFLEFCNSYIDKYPNAIKRINEYYINSSKKEGSISLPNIERLEIYMQYLETHDYIKSKSETSFHDIYPNCQDKICIVTWFKKYRGCYKDEYLSELEKRKDKYPNAYQKMMDSYQKSLKLKEQFTLSQQEKLDIYMQYIEEHEILGYLDNIKFKDIYPDAEDETNIYSWSRSHIFISEDRVMQIITEYEKKYPKACKKILVKFKEIIIYRDKKEKQISKEQKIKLLLEYLETHEFPRQGNELCFCDIDTTIQDDTNVANWFRDRRNREEEVFIKECSKYQSIYPNGYQRLMDKVKKLLASSYVRKKVQSKN